LKNSGLHPWLISGLAFFVNSILFAQGIVSPMASRFPDLGAYSESFADVISAMNNQAALAEIKQVQLGVYGERTFMLENAGFFSLLLAVPAFSGNFGIQADYFGYPEYNESQFGLAYGRRLGEKINLGAKFNFFMLRVAGYGSASSVNCELGCTWAIAEKLRTGIHVYNLFGGKFPGIPESKLPYIFKSGLGYEPGKQLLVGIEAIKEENTTINIKAGVQYKFADRFIFRLAFATGATSNFFVIGYSKQNLRLELVASYHQQLGISPGVVLFFKSGKNKEQ
jgi:hypothetical protein